MIGAVPGSGWHALRRALRRQLTVLLVALALGLLVALTSFATVRAGGPSWVPSKTDAWQYQLGGTIDTTVDADVFDIDAFETSAATVTALHAIGRHVVCYIDAGSWESYRPDAGRYPASVIGRKVPGWANERWLDIRQLSVLQPILRARLDRCVAKGFDGVEFDWVDGYVLATGFPITRADQLRFDRWLATAAHRRGLAVGLKNALGLVEPLVPSFDFAVNEQCFQYRECYRYRPLLDAGKAVFNVEYDIPRSAFCDRAAALGIVAMRKHLELDAWRRAC